MNCRRAFPLQFFLIEAYILERDIQSEIRWCISGLELDEPNAQ